MAYAALVSLSQTVELFLNYHHEAISPQVKDQIMSINEYTIFLQDFLQHFKDKANRLESIIRDITHIVEDIVEFFMSIHIPASHYAVLALGAQFRHIHYNICDLKEAADEIEWIAAIVMKLKSRITVNERSPRDSHVVSSSPSSRYAPAYKDVMLGCDDDLMEIKSRLFGESSKLQVVPIVGMGGIGKTTLARNVFNDPLIMECFDVRDWVTVSQDYSVEEIISNLLVSMNVFDAKNESMKAHHVYQHLKNRKYLIVLDDIWSTESWDDLRMMFPDDGNGSRIMITTRLSDVASYTDSATSLHEMHLMDMDLSWKLLQQKIFKKEECPVELEDAGKEIARNCRGLPLAIVVISGILSSIDHTASAWDNIAKNVKNHISSDNEQFDKILSLSYTHLPHYLRPCFLYMGHFREDYEIHTSRLIKLWVAEGFLEPSLGNKSSEETAEEYLEDLIKRRLVLVSMRKSNGRIKSLSMHDLMRGMCLRITHKEKFLRHGHLSLSHDVNMIISEAIFNNSLLEFPEKSYALNIHTLLLSGTVRGATVRFSFQSFRLLRILDLLDASTPPLPAQVSALFHLRYLAFNGLFSSLLRVFYLRNLQTLMIYSNPHGKILLYDGSDHFPIVLDIWSMRQLRHLIVQSGFCFCLPPQHFRAKLCLPNLQTLSLAINFICTPEILEAIPNLKTLKISYSAFRDDEQDYMLQNLVHLQHLESLKLEIHRDFPFPEKVSPVFPVTLNKLSLSGVGLPWEDMKVVGSLPNLKVLKLRDNACNGDTWETAEGEFSELRFLLIDGSKLRDWITESSHFPKVARLVLHRCPDLPEIPNEIGDVPTLELIEVDDDDLFKSAKQIQEDQQSYGNEALQVRLVKRDDFS